MAVSALGYIGLEVRDTAAWDGFLHDAVGLMRGRPTPAGIATYRTDDQAQRLCLHHGASDDVGYLGFQVRDPAALQAVARQLEHDGFGVELASGDQCAERRVMEMIRTTDPDGLEVEIFCGPYLAPECPFRSIVCSGFVTAEQGLGHVVLSVADSDAARRFYEQALGFCLSDFVVLGPPGGSIEIVFLHCNPRHHTVALAPVPGGKRLLHFMVQMQNLNDVGSALDRCGAGGVPLSMGLGCHTNDHMVSFYAVTPSGFDVEIGSGARIIDEATWRVARHAAVSIWGHRRPH
ncbi:MAG: VOC family protein [Pseudomonadales bacterium]|jgi:biphenyl-2,3-diol 1,2-dioxygenase|nr:VOC family protein [Pseudomonadales bacterium]